MQIKKFTLISNNIIYGPEPAYDEEVEQRLTINQKGQVWFFGYKYGDGNGKAPVARKNRLTIDKDKVTEILSLLSQYLEENGQLTLDALISDIGSWSLFITEAAGIEKEFYGSLCEDYQALGNTELSARIREAAPIKDLFAFDGNPYNK